MTMKSLFKLKENSIQKTSRIQMSKYYSVIASVVLFFVAYVIGVINFRGFRAPQTFLNFFIDNAFMLVSATGMTLVILTGGIDLSVGAVVAFTTMLISWMAESGVSPWIAVIISLAVGCLLGYLMGCMIAIWNVPPFIATLAGMFFARGACYVISVESISILNPHLMELAKWKLRFGAMKGAPFVSLNVIIAIVVVFVGIYLSLYTKFGRNIYAIGGNEQSALLLGIPIKRIKILVYTLNGFCSALSGVVFSLYMLSGYGQHCVGMEMDVIAAVVIGGTLLSGGTGYVFGTMFGVLTLGIIQTWINYLNINSWWTKITVGLLLLIFIVLQRMIVAVAKKKE